MTVAAASCTGSASDPAAVTAPVWTLIVDTEVREAPDGLMPPRTAMPVPSGTTASRDSGAPTCHGSTPASMESGPAGCAGLDPVAFCIRGVGDEPPENDTTMMPAIRPTTRRVMAAARRRCRRVRRAGRDRRVTGCSAIGVDSMDRSTPRALDTTRLTWSDCALTGAIPHAGALDRPHCCWCNYRYQLTHTG